MKKLLYTFLAVSIIFSACKKEDDSPNNGSNNTLPSLIGTWEITNETGTETSGYLEPGTGTEVVTFTENFNNNYPFDGYTKFYSFSSDGVFTTSYYINGSLDNYNEDSYLLEENQLTLWMSGGGSTYTITTLTNTTLIYSWNFEGTSGAPGYATSFWRNTGSKTLNKYN